MKIPARSTIVDDDDDDVEIGRELTYRDFIGEFSRAFHSRLSFYESQQFLPRKENDKIHAQREENTYAECIT